MVTKSILIKKYENRRLYDATNSRYVNLDEVAALVQSGYDVRVMDVASGEDITRVILTQIIAEGAKTPNSGFPLDILRQMVIASGRASQESAVRYTKAMLEFYQSTYRAMAPALNPFDFLQGVPKPTGESEAMADQQISRPPAGTGQDAEEMSRLKDRVTELEKQISSSHSKPSVRKKPRRQNSARRST